jgi:hypothetical protein
MYGNAQTGYRDGCSDFENAAGFDGDIAISARQEQIEPDPG